MADGTRGLTGTQQEFVAKYIRPIPLIGKGKVKDKNDKLNRDFGSFTVKYNYVDDMIRKHITDKAILTNLTHELEQAGVILNRDPKAPDFDAAIDHLVYVTELLNEAKNGGPSKVVAKVRTDEERDRYRDINKNNMNVKRDVARTDTVNRELPDMKMALQKMDDAIAALKKERAEATDIEDMRKLEEEHKEFLKNRATLAGKIGQFERFAETKDLRTDRMLEASERRKTAVKNTESMADLLSNAPPVPPIPEIEDKSVYAARHVDHKDALAKNEELRAKVEFERNRVVRADVIFPGEPEIKTISKDQHQVLNAQLDNAKKIVEQLALLKEGDKEAIRLLKYTAALHNEVARDLSLYINSRVTGLPMAKEQPTDKQLIVLNALNKCKGRIAELYGRGSDAHDRLAVEAERLTGVIATLGKADKPDYKQADADLLALEKAIEVAFVSLTAPVKDDTIHKDALKKANAVAEKLATKLFNAEKLGPKDIAKIEKRNATYGPEGPPKDMIPLADVIEVDGVFYRVKTKSEKGKANIVRRDDKTVPRGVMEMLRGRVDALREMAETMAEGCDDMLAAYAKETEDLLTAHSDEKAHTDYKAIDELIKEVEKDFIKHKTMAAYTPSLLPVLMVSWNKAKGDLGKKKPADVLAALTTEANKIKDLLPVAKEVEKKYGTNKSAVTVLYWDLASVFDENGMGGGEDFGTQMGDLMNGRALRLAEANGASDEIIAQIEQAMDAMPAGQSLSDFQGPWRRSLEKANAHNIEKNQGAVEHAATLLETLNKEIAEFKKGLSNKKPDPAFLQKLADTMTAMSAGAASNLKVQQEYKTARDELRTIRKGIEDKISKKKNKKDYETQIKGLQAQQTGIEKEVDRTLNYELGIQHLKDLERDYTQLAKAAAIELDGKHETASKIKVVPRIKALEASLTGLADAASKLIADYVRVQLSDTQKADTDLVAKLDNSEKVLATIKDLAKLDELSKLAGQIDGEPKAAKETRVQRREAALEQVRRIRSRLESHPAVKLYHDNPFDHGLSLSLVRSNLHDAEIVVLASVDPRQKSE